MEKIASFTIDHNRLLRGVYVSRRDRTPSGDFLTTFDVRLTEPNRQAALSPEALHSMEHLAATFLRNSPEWKDRIVYWGPMGCCTGNYLIMQGDLTPQQIVPLLRDTFSFIADFEGEIPGATPKDCGNFSFNDLQAARKAAKIFLDEVLTDIKPENMKYPD
ncbi:MAG: S-ribosylhomocysteine lyase [Muribaculaceae bacterium]|nr:S-ribosylhomocysteine lyase [Muribaculaceae bacterium]MDE6753598.1 S-ribosylhomocysteine lyase [Muribaculaceae bacterium]